VSAGVTVAVAGTEDLMLRHGGYPVDEPAMWARYQANRARGRVGRGYRVAVTLSPTDWRDIADYLQSVVDCLADMQPHERGADGLVELRAGRIALERIGESIGVRSGQPWIKWC